MVANVNALEFKVFLDIRSDHDINLLIFILFKQLLRIIFTQDKLVFTRDIYYVSLYSVKSLTRHLSRLLMNVKFFRCVLLFCIVSGSIIFQIFI